MTKYSYITIFIVFVIFGTFINSFAEQISIPSCNELLQIGSNPYSISKSKLKKLFNKEVTNWTEADYQLLEKAYLTCNIPLYYNRHKYIAKVIKQIKKLVPKIYKYNVFLEGKISSARKDGSNYILNVRYNDFEVGNRKSSGCGTFEVPDVGFGLKQGEVIKCNFVAESKDAIIFDYKFLSWDKEFEAGKIAEKQQFEKQEQQKKAKGLKRQKEKEKIEKEKIDSLLKKWAKSGPPIEFLSSKFQTIAGAALSGEVCTVVEFLDNVKGDVQWQKRKNNLWVLNQTIEDDMTGEKSKIHWGFYDNRNTEGFVLLSRIIVDGQELPQSKLIYYVMKIIPIE